MQQYLSLLQHILDSGVKKSDRTGTGTISNFGYQMRFDLQKGFPLVTTKKVHFRSIVYELLWFLKGDTNIAYLKENGVRIWDEWADENGDLGPVYGKQWRSWKLPFRIRKMDLNPNQKLLFDEVNNEIHGITFSSQIRSWRKNNDNYVDQISQVIRQIKKKPDSRRLIVLAWNPTVVDEMALPPCHALFQFYVANGKLSCQLYQRSADIFLGVPFNIGSYALLTMMIAQVCDLEPGEFIHTFGDVHIYSNHIEQVNLQLSRTPFPLPTLKLNPNIRNIFDFKFEDFTLENYHSHPAIKAPVAV